MIWESCFLDVMVAVPSTMAEDTISLDIFLDSRLRCWKDKISENESVLKQKIFKFDKKPIHQNLLICIKHNWSKCEVFETSNAQNACLVVSAHLNSTLIP